MELSDGLKSYLAQECRFVATRLRAIDADHLNDGVYYYSAVFGCLSRALNIEYSDELCLAHQTTNLTFQAIAQRVASVTTGQEPSVGIPAAYFEWLADATDRLASDIEESQVGLETMALTARLGYLVNGNGFYLFTSGRLPAGT